MSIGSSIIYSAAIVGAIAIITIGITACDEREMKFRTECAQSGGMVILSSGSQNSLCIRK